MLLRDLVQYEVDRYIKECNFTEIELQYFLLKTKDYTNVKIAFELNTSKDNVSKIATRVKNKIIKCNEHST